MIDDLIGVPYVPDGRDPRRGLDCMGLLLEMLERFGVRLPDPMADPLGWSRYWIEIKRPDQKGDVVLMRPTQDPLHVGVMIDPVSRQFIHATSAIGVSVWRLRHVRRYIAGYFRARALA